MLLPHFNFLLKTVKKSRVGKVINLARVLLRDKRTLSPLESGKLVCPSKLTVACSPAYLKIGSKVKCPSAGKISGRWPKECGQMGVSKKTSTSGATIGPPAAKEYAVEPVGVETIMPSP